MLEGGYYQSIAVSPNNSTNKDSFGGCAVDAFLSAMFVTMIRTSNMRIKLIVKIPGGNGHVVGGFLSTVHSVSQSCTIKAFMCHRMFMN